MIPLALAIKTAGQVCASLDPICQRIVVAGSIRRRRPYVNDIDLVILPKPGQVSALQARCRQRCLAVREGDSLCTYRMDSGTQIDIFIARRRESDLLTTTPGNFGSVLLCRTGSAAHNIHMVARAKALGLEWSPRDGVRDSSGRIIASEEETDIFQAIKMDWIDPQDREV